MISFTASSMEQVWGKVEAPAAGHAPAVSSLTLSGTITYSKIRGRASRSHVSAVAFSAGSQFSAGEIAQRPRPAEYSTITGKLTPPPLARVSYLLYISIG